jgi:hypothetical protein
MLVGSESPRQEFYSPIQIYCGQILTFNISLTKLDAVSALYADRVRRILWAIAAQSIAPKSSPISPSIGAADLVGAFALPDENGCPSKQNTEPPAQSILPIH